MSATAVTRFRAILHLRKTDIPAVLALARLIYAAMLAGVAIFPAPIPTLMLLLAQITALDLAQQALATSPPGAATGRRNSARDALWTSLVSLKAYVQSVADASVESFTIIKDSGFPMLAPGTRIKPLLAAKVIAPAGTVKLTANVRALTGGSKKHTTFNWQYSVDGGHTWIPVNSTPVATTTIGGLPVGSNCSFRVSVTIDQTMQPWSQVVTIPVH